MISRSVIAFSNGHAHHQVVVEFFLLVEQIRLLMLSHESQVPQKLVALIRFERTHEVFVRPSGVDNLKASGGQEAGQHEDEQRETDDDRDVTPQAVPVPIVRRDLHDDCAAHAPSHEHLAGCNHPYFSVGEKLVPRSPVQHASYAAGRYGRAVTQHFNADDEIAQNGQRPEGVNYFAVRPQPFAEGYENDHPDNGQVEGQLEFKRHETERR